jgi:hypothetical protein
LAFPDRFASEVIGGRCGAGRVIACPARSLFAQSLCALFLSPAVCRRFCVRNRNQAVNFPILSTASLKRSSPVV